MSPMWWMYLGGTVLGLGMVIVLWRIERIRLVHPACPRCRYNLTDLPGTTCPECGLYLERAGRIKPGQLHPMGLRRCVTIFSIVMLIAGAFGARGIRWAYETYVPIPTYASFDTKLISPHSGAYESFQVTSEIESARFPCRLDYLITLTTLEGKTHELHYDDVKRRLWTTRQRDDGVEERNFLDAKHLAVSIRTWMSSQGIDNRSPGINEEVDYIAEIMQGTEMPVWIEEWSDYAYIQLGFNLGVPPFSGENYTSTFTDELPDPLLKPFWRRGIDFGPWILLWLLGVLILSWRARHRRRSFEKMAAMMRLRIFGIAQVDSHTMVAMVDS